MAWIKRNLFFVISVAVGLLLTGYCGYLLYSAVNANSDINTEYSSKRANLETLQQAVPFPSRENLQVVKSDQENLKKFLGEFRTKFAPFPPPPAEGDKGFRTYLEESMVRFRAEATNAGVQLPPDYGFSFSSLMGRLNYPPAAIAAWMEQLQEISTILDLLYQAKVNYLASLCRVPVSPDDAGSGDCLLQATSVTNVWGIVTPYKITFRGFSTELAAVMEGFARSSNCFIIKSVDVTQDKSVQVNLSQPVAQSQAPAVFTPQARMPNPIFNSPGRGGLIPGYRPPPPPAAAPTASLSAATSEPVIILAETPLLVTISVDVVKLKGAGH